jgi:hypothetical protein
LAEELWEVDWLLQSLYGFFFLRKVSKIVILPYNVFARATILA